jgi:AcrR family transcriptional regulator
MVTLEAPRQRLLAAMIRVVGNKGYAEASVADVLAAADVSRVTFYRYFEHKQQCFLSAYEMLIEQTFAELVASCDTEEAWASRMANGLSTLVDRLALDPAMARTAVVEVAAAGAAARDLHWHALQRFSEYLDGGRELTSEHLADVDRRRLRADLRRGARGRRRPAPGAAAGPPLRHARSVSRARRCRRGDAPHGPGHWGTYARRSFDRARWRRTLTVPSGIPSRRAIAAWVRSSA